MVTYILTSTRSFTQDRQAFALCKQGLGVNSGAGGKGLGGRSSYNFDQLGEGVGKVLFASDQPKD